MYKIGAFSKITGLTVKALRYYDEEELLRPSGYSEGGYRLYDEADFELAKMIVLLRQFDFSIAETREVISACPNPSDLYSFIEEKKTKIHHQIAEGQQLLARLERYLAEKGQPEAMPLPSCPSFHIKNLPKQLIVSKRFKGSYSDTPRHLPDLFRAAQGHGSGALFCLYYDDEYCEEADIEICLPVNKPVSGTVLKSRELPGISALTVTHQGPYESIGRSYKAIIDHAWQEGLALGLPSRELYVKGPGLLFKGKPQSYITEIQIPIS
ncbi:MAG: MerR family transcriptional regulator [Anaerolineaceae bacterium]|nr:MerR family transcriptional regulator [Anaerolineaceae bacterium]